METKSTPVIFIHGLWMHADSWRPWLEVFREAGYHAMAPSWPGVPLTVKEARAHPETMPGIGLDEIIDHYSLVIQTLDTKPIVVGHSTGGIVAQALLGLGLASACIAIDPAPIKGVLPLPLSSLRVAATGLKNPANRMHNPIALTQEEFRYGFGNALSEQESDDLYQRLAVPSPGRPLFQIAFANFTPKSSTKVNTQNPTRGPLLLISGGKDHTVPPVVVQATRKLYANSPAVTDFKSFPDRGHSLTIDHGWREVAEIALEWLDTQTIEQAITA